jgi:hypothetical protein
LARRSPSDVLCPGPADQDCRRHQYAAVRRRAVAVSLRSATINDQVGRCALRKVTVVKLPRNSYLWQFDKATAESKGPKPSQEEGSAERPCNGGPSGTT